MAPPAAVDPRSGYCADTGTFHSLRAPVPLPPPDLPISFPAFAFSLLPSPLPTRLALIDSATGEAVPFPAFLARVRALAAHLRASLSLAHGDVAFVLAPPGVHVPVLCHALMAVGAVVSPANPALTAGEVAGLVALSKPSVAFAVSSTVGKLPSGLSAVLLDSPRFLSFLQGPAGAHAAAVIHQSDPAAILYSSGTTGRAKAVVLTHRNLMLARTVPAPSPDDVPMLAVPMFHIYGFVFCLIAAMSAQTLVLHTARRFDARAVLAAVGRFRVTRLALAPAALMAVVRTAEEDGSVVAAASTLQTVLCGGAAVPAELIRRFPEKFPRAVVAQGYGLTETTAGFVRAIGAEEVRRIGSVGRLNWGTEAKIVDPETGDALPPGVPGKKMDKQKEVCNIFCTIMLESQHANWIVLIGVAISFCLYFGNDLFSLFPIIYVMLAIALLSAFGAYSNVLIFQKISTGYYGDKEATSAILDSEGWLRTGDVCRIDRDGFLFVVDRLKELIKCKGYQVAPAELEGLLQTHRDIDEAAVVGYSDDQAGELPVAFVVRRSGSDLSEAQIKAFVAEQVVHYKRIHHVFFVDSIPRNAAGKILRKDLVKSMLHPISSKL